MTKAQFLKSFEASKQVCEVLTAIISGISFKKLTSRQLFELLYMVRSLEHFQSIVLLAEREQYNSALALRRVLYETCLRGMWISRCASEKEIAAAREDNFQFPEQLLRRKKLEKELDGVRGSRFQVESKWYPHGCGFVHGGLRETAMYAVRTNPSVSQHLFRTLERELQLSTVRLLQAFLEFHLGLMQAALEAKPHGTSGIGDLMSRTGKLKSLAEQYQGALKSLKADTTDRTHESPRR